MRQTIKGEGNIDSLMRNQSYYTHEINLPANDFLGGTLTFDEEDIIVFGIIKEQAYSIRRTKIGNDLISRIKHRLVDPELIPHGDTENVMDTKACLLNVWIDGHKLKLEFRNHSGEIADINTSINYEVHK
ncbi:hypothetical protein [Tepidibacter mesophilus]|uniref:hypothetical protein n=1 Tax=Tepidibacter mesophilus TaxID=655607 RepID=UPI000C08B9EB|nr:hypothetical protein [Tepidibacter mesophilus]